MWDKMKHAQSGGLIDKYWLLNWIILPLGIIILIYLVLTAKWHFVGLI
jgi:hypothetical protein